MEISLSSTHTHTHTHTHRCLHRQLCSAWCCVVWFLPPPWCGNWEVTSCRPHQGAFTLMPFAFELLPQTSVTSKNETIRLVVPSKGQNPNEHVRFLLLTRRQRQDPTNHICIKHTCSLFLHICSVFSSSASWTVISVHKAFSYLSCLWGFSNS